MPGKIVSINPATEEKIAEYELLSLEKTLQELEKTKKAFAEWKEFHVSERVQFLSKAGKILRAKKQKYAEIMTNEMGKPISQALAEVEKCALACDFFAENAEKFLQNDLVKTEARKSYVAFQPLGNILGVMPWNFPFWQVFRFASSTLAVGNTVTIKHSSNVPGSALACEEVFQEAGLPENVFKVLLIDSKTVEKIIPTNFVQGVSLTGSTEAGRNVAQLSGQALKKTVLELGGSDPFVVLDDVDVSHCAQQAVQGRIVNSGQSCIAAKRFIVLESIVEEFTQKYLENMKNLRVGNPLEKETQIGPMARKDLVDALDAQVKKSVKEGAKLLFGGKKIPGKGFFYEPTLLRNVTEKMTAFNEETFGPVAGVISAKDDEDAVRLANKTIYGLGGSVWSKNSDRAERIALRIDAGLLYVNDTVKTDPRLPAGGVKESGYGRELGKYSLYEFANLKTVVVK
ncbi:MAG: NAD-dependent succinate-semialdehyde dehydrogenase [Candidatus Diapherotrites archaeon]|nr:NAD-dependent succinate-semialdehyde dehydrogenase [Candidatus Diapherotrites archaeon]